jgi:hypothetical protein
MLLKMDTVQGICDGRITHVYRRWKKPAAKVGGRQRTPMGELKVTSVDVLELDDLTREDAQRAGVDSLDALRAALSTREGAVYRIGIAYDRPDPRIALRQDTSPEAVAAVVDRLRKKDARVDTPWTRAILAAIDAEPGRRAQDLAEASGSEKKPFKRRVRQLKELGLTISLDTGYALSPRGKAVLAALNDGSA